ncbi:Flp pilus assembly complex ATPase component TadA [bacterium]|nr:Flp pilus assembly complex ATPase component TadA [bacterium]
MIRKRLGDALIDSGLITKEQLSTALGKQKELGKRLGKVLIELGMCAEEQIVHCLASQMGIPEIHLDEVKIPREIIKLIPETIVRSHNLLPVSKKGNILTVVMVDPLDAFIVDEIRYQTDLEVEEAIATETAILAAIKQYYGAGDVSKALNELKKDASSAISKLPTDGSFDLLVVDEAASVNFVSQIISQAIDNRASDIHFEPEEDSLRIRYRTDGVLSEVIRVPKTNQSEIISRVKIMADMDISEKRLPQDGRIRAKLTDKNVDLRVSSLPMIWGEKIVIRILDKSALKLSLKDVGFEDELLNRFATAIKQPNGIILLNGPTGSGKTSTLYAAINFIYSPKINISTVEDPVEIQLRGINQVHVRTDIGLTFARTLRSLMRQDPNVIMIGEIRDPETAQIAAEAALTGHLVLSTLHTNDAPSSITRLIDLEVEPFLISSTLLAALAQRLVRVICPKCIQPFSPPSEQMSDLQLEKHDFREKLSFFQGTGCNNCGTTGFRGRTAIHEMMTLDDSIRRLVNSKAAASDIRNAAVKGGMKILRSTAIQKASKGITTVSEVLRVTKSEEI